VCACHIDTRGHFFLQGTTLSFKISKGHVHARVGDIFLGRLKSYLRRLNKQKTQRKSYDVQELSTHVVSSYEAKILYLALAIGRVNY